MAALLLLTGRPGAGKTTLLRRVADALRPRRIGGFTTEEIREGGVRRGFRLVPFGGEARVLARVDLAGPARVGRYGVDVAAIDAVSDSALAPDPAVELYLVDEIGKMECLSARFVAAMRRLLDGDRPVAATVGRSGGGFIAEVKRRPEAEVWEVTPGNRDALVARVIERLKANL
ncbi:MAG: nucleoside-triphosphatase [Candidatus Binatia bacterium]